ncbi:MAG: hypothetical protein IJS47_04735 [Clostridia bacterium]|nr:hypothetical protein [Clostridia bacterium]
MSNNSSDVKTKKGISIKNAVIALLVLAYFIMFIHTFFAQNVETIILTSGEIEELDEGYGIITRSEKVVSSDVKGVLYPQVNSGERVSKGQVVAVVKNEQVKEVEKKIYELNEQIDSLKVPSLFNNDIKVLDGEISTILSKIIKDDYYKFFSDASNYKRTIDSKMQKKAKIIGSESPIGSVEQNYIAQLEKYEAELNNVQSEIIAPIAGTVVYRLDGYENILTEDAISTYNAKNLEELNISKGELVGTLKENSLKIVDNIEGYVTVSLNSERASNADVDQKVNIRFPEIDNSLIIPGRIDYINRDKEGNSVITIRINRAIESLLNYRKVKVDVIWKTTEGYKVPSNAIVKTDEGNVVYIMVGRNYIVERKVDIVDEFGDYAIIQGTDGDRLYLYDSVILNASKVNTKKMLYKS